MTAALPSLLFLPMLVFATPCAVAAPCVNLAGSATPIAADTPGVPALPSATLGPAATIAPETVTLQSRPVLYVTGDSKWDDSEKSLGDAFHAVYGEIARLNLRAAGVPMVEYVDSDDEKFIYKAMVPISEKPAAALEDEVAVGDSPAGSVLKFVHAGARDDMEQFYNRIDDYLAANHLTMKRVVEEYQTDRTKTPPDEQITNIYVFAEKAAGAGDSVDP